MKDLAPVPNLYSTHEALKRRVVQNLETNPGNNFKPIIGADIDGAHIDLALGVNNRWVVVTQYEGLRTQEEVPDVSMYGLLLMYCGIKYAPFLRSAGRQVCQDIVKPNMSRFLQELNESISASLPS